MEADQQVSSTITGRRVIVAFHNGRRLVNKKGINNFFRMDEVQKDYDIQLKFEGEIQLDNVLINESGGLDGVIIVQFDYEGSSFLFPPWVQSS